MRLVSLLKLIVVAITGALIPVPVLAERPPILIKVATTPTVSERLTHDEARPGFLVELFNRIEPLANVEFEYVFTNWDQVLRLIRTGRVDAGFNSSFKADRSVYGAYPMVDGKPDPSRATIEYYYSFFTYGSSKITWDGKTLQGLNGPVGIEKGASILPTLNKLGIQTQEIKTYESMVSLLAGGRISVVAAIDHHLGIAATTNDDRYNQLKKLTPPLQQNIGYLMFSKRFCTKSPNVCEDVWNGIRTVKKTDEYKAVRAQYTDN